MCEKKTKVLVLGCHKKSSNFGVQMLSDGTESVILNLFPNAQITYFEEFLETIPNRTISIRFLSKYKRAFLLAKENDLVFLVNGGDSFTDQYGMRRFLSVYLYFISVKCSKTFSILAPQTIGPFSKLISRKLTRIKWIYPNMNFARDQKSFEYLESIGLDHVQRTSDVAFNFERQDSSLIEKEFDFCLNISGLLWKQNSLVEFSAYQEIVTEVIEYILSQDKRLIITPHVIGKDENDNDLDAIRELKERYSEGVDFLEPASPMDVANCLKKSKVAIGSRMHFCINALRNNVEVIALSYSPKFRGTLEDYSKAIVFEISDLQYNREDLMLKLRSLNEKSFLETSTNGSSGEQRSPSISIKSNLMKKFEWHQSQYK